MSSIFFSVVVPVFNKGGSIERMLASVLNQQYMPSEIIIVNDGSTDNSIQLINFNLKSNFLTFFIII